MTFKSGFVVIWDVPMLEVNLLNHVMGQKISPLWSDKAQNNAIKSWDLHYG